MTHSDVPAQYEATRRVIVGTPEMGSFPPGWVEGVADSVLPRTGGHAGRVTSVDSRSLSEREQRQNRDSQDNGVEHGERCGR